MSRQIISISHKKNISSPTVFFFVLFSSQPRSSSPLDQPYPEAHRRSFQPVVETYSDKQIIVPSQEMMSYKSALITAILLAVVCLIQGAFADGYEGLCVAALESDDFNNETTTKCCQQVLADLDDTIPLYVTCANMSKGQLDDFAKCCPIIVHVDSKNHRGKGKIKNDKRDTSKRIRRNSKRRNDSE